MNIKSVLKKVEFKRLIEFLLLVPLSFCSFTNAFSQENSFGVLLYSDSCFINQKQQQNNWFYNAREDESAFTGNFCSTTDKGNPYGITYKNTFLDNILGKNIYVIIDAYVRAEIINTQSSIDFKIIQDENIIYWKGININSFIKKENEWAHLADTIILPRSLVNKRSQYSFYLSNNNDLGKTDVDDVRLTIREMEHESYLPKIKSNATEKGGLIFKNNYYSIFYSKKTGNISVGDNKQVALLSNIVYYLEYKSNYRDKKTLIFESSEFGFLAKTDSLLEFEMKSKLSLFKLKIEVGVGSELKFYSETTFNKDLIVAREAIITEYTQAIDEVYTKNRKLVTDGFSNEYWLDKQGVKIGINESSIIAYHLPTISSLQLNKNEKELTFNLDFKYDHLRMIFPLLKDTLIRNFKQDVSSNEYKRGYKKSQYFSLFVGIEPISIPRFMKSPKGFKATYIFTEHADFSDLKINYAVNFGSEQITQYKNAIGGFAKYHIPVTKSVFYHNPEKITNYQFNKNFTSDICNVKSTPGYLNLLKELKNNGFEICLHTPEQYTSNTRDLTEALTFFNKEFNSVSWIDHGYDNLPNENRENFVCDGFNSKSPFYFQPLYKKFNVKYFWNCYNEDSSLYKKYCFNSNLKQPFIGFGEFIPLPDYSKHLINNEEVISWQATSLVIPKEDNLWSYWFNNQRLNTMINENETVVNHCYPSRVDSASSFFEKNEKGEFIVNNQFNAVLEKLALLRDSGKINLTTIKEYLNYNLALENIEYKIIDAHSVQLTNNNNFEIKDLSFIIQSKEVFIENKIIHKKTDNESLIFWFDLKANEKLIIRF